MSTRPDKDYEHDMSGRKLYLEGEYMGIVQGLVHPRMIGSNSQKTPIQPSKF
jgi:hypothetical protein